MQKVQCYICAKEFRTIGAGVPEKEIWNVIVKGKEIRVQEEVRYLSKYGHVIELCAACKEALYRQTGSHRI